MKHRPRLSLRRGGRHAADVITSDSLLLTDRRPVVTVPAGPFYVPSPVTAPAVPDAPTEAFAPPWHANPGYSPPPVPRPDCEPARRDVRLADPLTVADWPVPAAGLRIDYRALPVYQSVVRGACRVGLLGIGTRGIHVVTELPDYGLDRFTVPAEPEGRDVKVLFDEVAEHAADGFFRASRWWHRADTTPFRVVRP